MNIQSYEQVVRELETLAGERRASFTPRESCARLPRLAARLIAALEGTDAARLINERADEYDRRLSPVTGLGEELRRHFAVGVVACQQACGSTEALRFPGELTDDSHEQTVKVLARFLRPVDGDSNDSACRLQAQARSDMLRFADGHYLAGSFADPARLPLVVGHLEYLWATYQAAVLSDLPACESVPDPDEPEDDVIGLGPLPLKDVPVPPPAHDGRYDPNRIGALHRTLTGWLDWVDARHFRAAALIRRYTELDRQAADGPASRPWWAPPTEHDTRHAADILAAARGFRLHLQPAAIAVPPTQPLSVATGEVEFHHEELCGSKAAIVRALCHIKYGTTDDPKHFAILVRDDLIRVRGSGKSLRVKLPNKGLFQRAQSALEEDRQAHRRPRKPARPTSTDLVQP